MKKLRILSTALAMAALLTTQALAVPAAELVRVFAAGDALYTYVSITGAEAPITKAEAKLGQRSFPASGPLETVRQAGFPVEYLLLVDNSNSMPPFREEVSAFAAALTEEGGENTVYALASFGDKFTLEGEELEAETLARGVEDIPMGETVTRLNSSIAQALEYFEAIPRTGNQLRCLVVLTDAVQYDPEGGVPYEDLVDRLEHSDVMLHSVGLGTDTDALERMASLALASGGTHRNVSNPEEAAQAARALALGNGELLVTSFDIGAYYPAGGTEPVYVTFASGGELVCRSEGTVELSPAEEVEPPASEAPAEDPAQTLSPSGQPAEPPSAGSQMEHASGPPTAAIIGGAAVFSALTIVLVLILRRRKSIAPAGPESPVAAPAEPSPAAQSSIYLRLDVPEGIAIHGDLEWNLVGEIVLGNSPECDVVLGELETPAWQLRIFLKEGAIWCAPVSGSILVNRERLQTERHMRSGDTVRCGAVSVQLRF